jgi:hypothetical protein
LRDKNPQLEEHGGTADPRGIVRGIRTHNSNNKMASARTKENPLKELALMRSAQLRKTSRV